MPAVMVATTTSSAEGNIKCSDTIVTASDALSRNGFLFLKNFSKLGILKIMFNTLVDISLATTILLNVKNALRTNNIRLLNSMACLFLPLMNFVTRRVTLIKDRKRLVSLLADLDSVVFNNHSKKHNRHIRLINRTSNFILRYFLVSMAPFVLVTCLLPLVINMNELIPNPFENGRFGIAYKFVHFTLVVYSAYNYAAFDVFYMTLIGIDIAQLDILEERLKSIVSDVGHNFSSTAPERNLKECIILHKMIIKFTNKLSSLLSVPLFLQYVVGCLIICNAILRMTIMGERDTTHLIGIISYSSVTFAEIAAYHWLGNEVSFKSDKIVEFCYVSNWYETNVACQKSLMLLMERAQRPLVINVFNFIHIGLESLLVIVRWSYSLFALIKVRYN